MQFSLLLCSRKLAFCDIISSYVNKQGIHFASRLHELCLFSNYIFLLWTSGKTSYLLAWLTWHFIRSKEVHFLLLIKSESSWLSYPIINSQGVFQVVIFKDVGRFSHRICNAFKGLFILHSDFELNKPLTLDRHILPWKKCLRKTVEATKLKISSYIFVSIFSFWQKK